MKTFALILSSLSVAFASYLPANSIYNNRLLQRRQLQPYIIAGSTSRSGLAAGAVVDRRQPIIVQRQTSLDGRGHTQFRPLRQVTQLGMNNLRGSQLITLRPMGQGSTQTRLNNGIGRRSMTFRPLGAISTQAGLNERIGDPFAVLSPGQLGARSNRAGLNDRLTNPIVALQPTLIRRRVNPTGLIRSIPAAGASSISGRVSTGTGFQLTGDNNGRFVNSERAFVGTLTTSPNGELTVIPLSSSSNSMNVRSTAVGAPSVRGMSVLGVQEVVNPFTAERQLIDF